MSLGKSSASYLAAFGLALAAAGPLPGAAEETGPPPERVEVIFVVGGGRDLSAEVRLVRDQLGSLEAVAGMFPRPVRLRYGIVHGSRMGGEEGLAVVPPSAERNRAAQLLAAAHAADPVDAATALAAAFELPFDAGDRTRERHVVLITDDAPDLAPEQLGDWYAFIGAAESRGIVLDVLAAPLFLSQERTQIWQVFSGMTYGTLGVVPLFHEPRRGRKLEFEVMEEGEWVRKTTPEEDVGPAFGWEARASWTAQSLGAFLGMVAARYKVELKAP